MWRIGVVCLTAVGLAGLVAWSYRIAHSDDPPPPAPISLITGIGNLNHPIVTRNAEAQKFFNQGLTLVYGFDVGQAVRSFQRAAQLDPHSPMPYWGIALAYGPNYNRPVPGFGQERAAYEAIQIAQKLSSAASDEERAYIDALAYRYSAEANPDLDKLASSYADAMRNLYHSLPEDPDAAALYAESLMDLHPWQLWTNDGNPQENTTEIIQVLERALYRWPNHVGLNHFYIHTMEGSPDPERALRSARLLETLVPACSHLVHMPAHVYFRAGDYADAVRVSESAVTVDDSQSGEPTSFTGYMHHNLMYLAAAAMMDGDFEHAYDTLAALMAAHSQLYEVSEILLPLRFGEWDQALAATEPGSTETAARMFWRYARAVAFAKKSRAIAAEKERGSMEEEYARLSPGRAFGALFNDWSALHAIALEVLDARIDEARNRTTNAIAHWRRAIQVEDNLAFDDLPDWYYPVRESLGASLYRARRFKEAEQVFREDLRKTPKNPRSFFGLWKTLEEEKQRSEAEEARREFQAGWRGGSLRIEDF